MLAPKLSKVHGSFDLTPTGLPGKYPLGFSNITLPDNIIQCSIRKRKFPAVLISDIVSMSFTIPYRKIKIVDPAIAKTKTGFAIITSRSNITGHIFMLLSIGRVNLHLPSTSYNSRSILTI